MPAQPSPQSQLGSNAPAWANVSLKKKALEIKSAPSVAHAEKDKEQPDKKCSGGKCDSCKPEENTKSTKKAFFTAVHLTVSGDTEAIATKLEAAAVPKVGAETTSDLLARLKAFTSSLPPSVIVVRLTTDSQPQPLAHHTAHQAFMVELANGATLYGLFAAVKAAHATKAKAQQKKKEGEANGAASELVQDVQLYAEITEVEEARLKKTFNILQDHWQKGLLDGLSPALSEQLDFFRPEDPVGTQLSHDDMFRQFVDKVRKAKDAAADVDVSGALAQAADGLQDVAKSSPSMGDGLVDTAHSIGGAGKEALDGIAEGLASSGNNLADVAKGLEMPALDMPDMGGMTDGVSGSMSGIGDSLGSISAPDLNMDMSGPEMFSTNSLAPSQMKGFLGGGSPSIDASSLAPDMSAPGISAPDMSSVADVGQGMSRGVGDMAKAAAPVSSLTDAASAAKSLGDVANDIAPVVDAPKLGQVADVAPGVGGAGDALGKIADTAVPKTPELMQSQSIVPDKLANVSSPDVGKAADNVVPFKANDNAPGMVTKGLDEKTSNSTGKPAVSESLAKAAASKSSSTPQATPQAPKTADAGAQKVAKAAIAKDSVGKAVSTAKAQDGVKSRSPAGATPKKPVTASKPQPQTSAKPAPAKTTANNVTNLGDYKAAKGTNGGPAVGQPKISAQTGGNGGKKASPETVGGGNIGNKPPSNTASHPKDMGIAQPQKATPGGGSVDRGTRVKEGNYTPQETAGGKSSPDTDIGKHPPGCTCPLCAGKATGAELNVGQKDEKPSHSYEAANPGSNAPEMSGGAGQGLPECGRCKDKTKCGTSQCPANKMMEAITAGYQPSSGNGQGLPECGRCKDKTKCGTSQCPALQNFSKATSQYTDPGAPSSNVGPTGPDDLAKPKGGIVIEHHQDDLSGRSGPDVHQM